MATSLSKTMNLIGSVYYNKKFLNQFEDHIPYVKERGLFTVVSVAPAQALQFKGDLFGLFRSLEIPERFHYPCMRLMGLTNSFAFDGETTEVCDINRTFYDNLANTWKTQNPTG